MVRFWLLPLAVLALACAPQYPGDPVGTFDVTGALVANSCGHEAVPALDPVEFPVELRARQTQAYWRRGGARLVSGYMDHDGVYHFLNSTRIPAPAVQTEDGPGCTLVREETLEIRVLAASEDGGEPEDAANMASTAPPSALAGQHTIDIRPDRDSACSPLLVTQGGPFDALPCRIEYELVGAARAPF